MTRSSLLSQDRYARAAWSRLAEPADPVAGELIRRVGAVVALEAVTERADPILDRFRPRLPHLDLEADLAAADRVGARLVVPSDPDWPLGLNDLANPPHCLWVRGSLPLAPACVRSVAVVGARAATGYGTGVAAELAAELAGRGFLVVSGAAFGIDGAAHRGALAVDGATVAVLAGGIDRPYPAAHVGLLDRIAARAAVVAEVAPGSVPLKSRFLLRNRLIATMTQGTVVVEAGLRSGARNTASTAACHHRVVAAFPGPVTSAASAGCHELVRSGVAVLVTDAAEVAEAVGHIGSDLAAPRRGPARPDDGVPELDRRVLDVLPLRHPQPVASVSALAGIDEATARAALGRLDLAGLAQQHPQGWRRRPGRRRPGSTRDDKAGEQHDAST